ncbi:MAG TPA: ABC transporter permease [bacterium]|nr:ABC transporter permease [bacterium]
MNISYPWRLVARNGRRSRTYVFGLALAVGLFSGILFFIDGATRQMTAAALAPVTLDIVAHQVNPAEGYADIAPAIAAKSGVLTAETVVSADFAGACKAGQSKLSPSGRMFALAPSYLKNFDLVQVQSGTFSAGSVVISEAMALSEGITLGDSLAFNFAGLDKPVVLPVSGIARMDKADPLFATSTEAENALVSDVAFVDLGWFNSVLQVPLQAMVANPPNSLAPGSILIDPQVHIKIDRNMLPSDPTLAALHTDSLRRSIERLFSGRIKAVDNLSGALATATSDVLSARILFIFLGLPGILLAAWLSKFAAELFADSQRREISLLRTRGARPVQIGSIVALSSLFLALAGSAVGLLVGLGLLSLAGAFSEGQGFSPLAAGFDWAAFSKSALIAFAAGLVLTFLAAFLPTMGTLRSEITQERRSTRRIEKAPFWKRSWLDVAALIASGIVLLVTSLNGGFKPTGNEGQAVSLAFYIFLAPLFAWIGLTLLTLRVLEKTIASSTVAISRIFRRLFGEIGETAGKSLCRRAPKVSAAVTVIALTLSFGVSLILFQRTYEIEKQRDAQYIVGADIRVTPAQSTPQVASFAESLVKPGVIATTAVTRDTKALIGSEQNTVYGIDVPAFRETAYLPDSFFIDGSAPKTITAMRDRKTIYAPGSATTVLGALASTPNGVIISVEQAEKYDIRIGDPVLMRLYNRAANRYVDLKTVAVGFFTYFPTSSQDSDFIINRDYMTVASGTAMDYFLIKTDGAVKTNLRISSELAATIGTTMPIRIQTTETVVKVDSSSMTSLNLDGLGIMELVYSVIVATIGLAVFLLAMVNERRREFGAMRALGADLRTMKRFLFAEATAIGGLSLVVGAAIGFVLARLLVTLLSVLFTIPAIAPVAAWPELGVLFALVSAGMILSAFWSGQSLSRLQVVEVLREL